MRRHFWKSSRKGPFLCTYKTKERYSVYSTFKSSLSLSAYLNELKHVKARNFLIRLRLGVSPLRTHKLRYRKDVTLVDYFCPLCVGNAETQVDYFCPLCVGNAETEVYFIRVCPAYAEITKQYIPRKYFNCPSSFKLALLLATTSKFLLIRLATYLMKAFTIRNAWIFSTHWLWRYVLKCMLCMYVRMYIVCMYVFEIRIPSTNKRVCSHVIVHMCLPPLKWA